MIGFVPTTTTTITRRRQNVSFALLWLLQFQQQVLSASASAVVVLTANNFVDNVQGKAVFIKFFAPWCGHCKSMKGDWEKVAADWEGSETGLVGEVDCTDEEGGGDLLCEEYGVESFPTVMHGDAFSPEVYEDERDYETMSEFAKKHLTQVPCNIHNMNTFCPKDTKTVLQDLMAKSREELEAMEVEIDTELAEAEVKYDEQVELINEQYEQILSEYNAKLTKIRDERHYKWLQMVLAESDEPLNLGDFKDDNDDDDDDDDENDDYESKDEL